MLNPARQKQRIMQSSTWKIVAFSFVAVVVLYLLLVPGHQKSSDEITYGIMLDAGSTGSRIHIYKFRADTRTAQLVLDSEVFRHLEPGLSSFKDDPAQGAQSLVPLLDVAVKTVPAHLHKTTPINLKATAGLRLLSAAKADALLEAVRGLLKSYPFYYDQSDAVEIMGGDDEGLFGWVTINYLRNSLHAPPERTAAVLDLGGGSTQIALSVPPQGAGGSSLKVTSVMGQEHHMYVYSHLGYGLMAGRMGMFALGLPADDARLQGAAPLDHACLFPGAQASYEYGAARVAARGRKDASFHDCLGVARALMRKPDGSFRRSAPQPSPRAGQPVFAMSYYFDRAVDANLVSPSAVRAELTPQHYRTVAQQVCQTSPAAIPTAFTHVKADRAPFLCMDLCFISALLEDGFGLAPDTPLVLAKKLEFNGELVETAWSLGASLAEISETQQQL